MALKFSGSQSTEAMEVMIMSDMISFDFTLDNILSVKAPKGTDPDTLHEAVRDKLITLIQGKHECFMFEGTFEEDSND